MQIQIEANLAIQLAVLQMTGLRVQNTSEAYGNLERCAEGYAHRYAGKAVGEVTGVEHARKLFRAIGLEPTRRRPSSEALLNRALKGKGFFAVNELVDTGNWCSLDFLLPIGIYDYAQLSGAIALRRGGPEDRYAALNQREMQFEDRYVLCDDRGAFGSPLTDSLRSAVSEKTTRALMFIYAPQSYPRLALQEHAATFADRVKQICSGQLAKQMLLPRHPS